MCLCMCVCLLLSLRSMLLKFIHYYCVFSNLVLFVVEQWFIVWIHYKFIIHSQVQGHLNNLALVWIRLLLIFLCKAFL